MQDIVNAIATVGFPIVMCVLLLYTNNEEGKRHQEEMNELRKTVENNTLAIVQLMDKLERWTNNGEKGN